MRITRNANLITTHTTYIFIVYIYMYIYHYSHSTAIEAVQKIESSIQYKTMNL